MTRWRAAGEGPAYVRLGGRVLYPVEALRCFGERGTRTCEPGPASGRTYIYRSEGDDMTIYVGPDVDGELEATIRDDVRDACTLLDFLRHLDDMGVVGPHRVRARVTDGLDDAVFDQAWDDSETVDLSCAMSSCAIVLSAVTLDGARVIRDDVSGIDARVTLLSGDLARAYARAWAVAHAAAQDRLREDEPVLDERGGAVLSVSDDDVENVRADVSRALRLAGFRSDAGDDMDGYGGLYGWTADVLGCATAVAAARFAPCDAEGAAIFADGPELVSDVTDDDILGMQEEVRDTLVRWASYDRADDPFHAQTIGAAMRMSHDSFSDLGVAAPFAYALGVLDMLWGLSRTTYADVLG